MSHNDNLAAKNGPTGSQTTGASHMKLGKLAGAIFLSAMLTGLASPTAVQAQSNATITLKSFDGFTQLRGELVEFDGSTFTIKTSLGQIQVDALQVNCEGEACPENLLFGAKFGIFGSNTIGAELMPALIEGYADTLDATLVSEVGLAAMEYTLRVVHQNGEEMAAIDLRAHGSSASYAALADGTAAIGMSSRRARDRDIAVLVNGGIPDLRDTDNEHVVALDGLVVVTHPSNPIRSISVEELALVFSGQITDWSQLGGIPGRISVYAMGDQTGTFQTFGSLVLAPTGALITPTAQRFQSNVELSDSVAGDPQGIGVTGYAFQRAAKALPIRQECGILSYPTTFAMKTEEYPLSRRLYLYTPPSGLAAHAKQLVQFALSDSAQPLIAEAGFVNQSVENQSIDEQGPRLIYGMTSEPDFDLGTMREMLLQLRDAERLSTTFRFTPGSSNLTPKSRLDAKRLAEELSRGAYGTKEILLVGFTDSIGQFALNRGLAVRRAQVVENEIRAAVAPGALASSQIAVQGYGELTPVGCNTTLPGRTANRRVEVWIRDRL